MNKKITVLAIDEQVSLFFRRELKEIFADLFSIEYRNMEMKPIPPVHNTDLILYTDPEILNLLIDRIHCDAPKLMMKRTISREALKKIGQIPAGEKVLVANINQYMANETMALIYQLGITDIRLYPFYEGIKDYPDNISYIIVPEDRPYDFLPDIEAEIILTGNRVFDISNVVDILSILGIDNRKAEDIIRRYLVRVPTFWYGFDYSWQNRRVLLQQWKLLLNELSEGVIISDASEQIELINEKAGQLLKFTDRELTGEHLPDIVQQRKEFGLFLSTEDKRNELIKFQDRDLVLTIKIVEHEDSYYGKIIFIKPYREMVKVQQKLHRKIVGKGYYSSYEFSDIIGQNSEFVKTKELARKIARSSSTVLLLGESGTGKELFAGAIHNYSPRSEKPFVALNCSTLPENLLESELFGYEEGAFTGAKKGGKIGHFERAHQGTLFLDEIADLPLKLQARLLRALEEKEIMRVGGDSVISVDVRIIAASNKNLWQLVEEGKFRRDLFFRLNVLQLQLPPLRRRRDDLLLLLRYFLTREDEQRQVKGDFLVFARNYHWPGNVRELKNTLEYMLTISREPLSFQNAPDYLKKRDYYQNDDYNGRFLVLRLIHSCNKREKNSGRRSLTTLFRQKYYQISEMEIRELIQQLADEDLIVIHKGRKGNEITARGIDKLKDFNFIL